MRYELLTTAVLMCCLAGPAVSAQQAEPPKVSCVTACGVNPVTAPPECDCALVATGGGGSGAPSAPPPTPQQVFARETVAAIVANYEAAVAGIDNYYVVETTSIAKVPAVHYFEKEVVDGYSEFNLISPIEIKRREQAANPSQSLAPGVEVGPAEILKGIDALLGAAAGAAYGAMGEGPLGSVMNKIYKLRNEAQELEREQSQRPTPVLPYKAFERYGDLAGYGLIRSAQPPDRRFVPLLEVPVVPLGSLEMTAFSESPAGIALGDGIPADAQRAIILRVVAGSSPGLDAEVAALGMDPSYQFEKAEMWVVPADSGDAYKPVLVRATFSGSRVVERETVENMTGAPYVPRTTKLRLSGFDFGAMMPPEIVNTIEEVTSNEGPPNDQDVKAILGRYLGQQ